MKAVPIPARITTKGELRCGRKLIPKGYCEGLIGVIIGWGPGLTREEEAAVITTREEAFADSEPSGGPVERVARLPVGTVEDPPGSHFWRPRTRADLHHGRENAESLAGPLGIPSLPWRRKCPACQCIALVNRAVLSS